MDDLERQIDQLANFIMADVDGEPCKNEGAVECAIRIIKHQQARVKELEGALGGVIDDLHRRSFEVDSDGVKILNISNGVLSKAKTALNTQTKE